MKEKKNTMSMTELGDEELERVTGGTAPSAFPPAGANPPVQREPFAPIGYDGQNTGIGGVGLPGAGQPGGAYRSSGPSSASGADTTLAAETPESGEPLPDGVRQVWQK